MYQSTPWIIINEQLTTPTQVTEQPLCNSRYETYKKKEGKTLLIRKKKHDRFTEFLRLTPRWKETGRGPAAVSSRTCYSTPRKSLGGQCDPRQSWRRRWVWDRMPERLPMGGMALVGTWEIVGRKNRNKRVRGWWRGRYPSLTRETDKRGVHPYFVPVCSIPTTYPHPRIKNRNPSSTPSRYSWYACWMLRSLCTCITERTFYDKAWQYFSGMARRL